jgi:YfiH family protein
MTATQLYTSMILTTDGARGFTLTPFHSRNLGYGTGDSAESVAANRLPLQSHPAIDFLLSAKQIHKDRIFTAEAALVNDLEIDGYDALMTDIPGMGLMIQQADCQAVTLFDPIHSAVAAVHCGWKGSVLNIIGKTIQAMTRRYNSHPNDLNAYISASLGPCCAEFINYKKELPKSFLEFRVHENYFDFWKISQKQLLTAGLQEKNIQTAKVCTACSRDHYSYRRACREGDGSTGRAATIIVLQ